MVVNLRVITKVAYAAVALVAVLTTFCGEPLESPEWGWSTVAVLPTHYSVSCIATFPNPYSNKLVLLGTTGKGPVSKTLILSFDGTRFKNEFYYPPNVAENNVFVPAAIYSYEGVVWASPSIITYGEQDVLCRKDEYGWRTIEVPFGPGVYAYSIMPLGREECLLICFNDKNDSDMLVLYKNGAFRLLEGKEFVSAIYRDVKTGWLYSITTTHNKPVFLIISTDKGNTWIRELIDSPIIPGHEKNFYWLVAAHDGVAYLTNGYSIVKRTGPPGQGKYSLAFLSNTGPAFHRIDSLAVAEDGAVMAVGNETCVYGRGDAWVIERMPYSMSFKALTAASDHGFYAVAVNESFANRTELLYHP